MAVERVNRDRTTPPTAGEGVHRMRLAQPAAEHLASYIAALERGWQPNSVRPESVREELERIAADPARFLADETDREAAGPPVILPDGTRVERIPGIHLWMWDGSFAGRIGLRWQPGTAELPSHVLGHAGYSVVPWRRGRGYATRALALLLPIARAEGLPYIDLTTDAGNVASQRVIARNGGVLVERFRTLPAYGGSEALRYRITLGAGAPA